MVYVEIGITPVWSYKNESDVIEGVFKRVIESKNNREPSYILETLEGERLIWGSAVLTTKMSELSEGDKIKITYLGIAKTNAVGKSPAKLFKVERDE